MWPRWVYTIGPTKTWVVGALCLQFGCFMLRVMYKKRLDI